MGPAGIGALLRFVLSCLEIKGIADLLFDHILSNITTSIMIYVVVFMCEYV
jgi:hypothetical protein